MKLSLTEKDMLHRANQRWELAKKNVNPAAVKASEDFKEAVKGRIWRW